MPFYDLVCSQGHEQLNILLKVGERPPCPTCGDPVETLWRQSSNVIGDDIPGGIWIKHAICHPDGSPKRYDTKSSIHQAAKEAGYVNQVTHVTANDTDKNPYTTSWITGPPPGVDPRPHCLLTEEEQQKRHEEWLSTEP